MDTFRKTFFGLFLVALVAVLGGGTQAQTGGAASQRWTLKSQRPAVVGGYGDNFSYDGSNVRPLNGTAVIDIDAAAKTGTIVANVQTTPESGPLFVTQTVSVENGVKKVTDEYLEGNIRFEMRVGDAARFQQFQWLHGNTGNEAPVMPGLFNFLAAWAPIDVYVNDELAYEGLSGHLMYSEQARRDDGSIRRDDGTVYSPKLEDKSRFTVPGGRELHLIAHSTTPDENNFPPHTRWIHLVFYDVFVQNTPGSGGEVLQPSPPLQQLPLPPATQPEPVTPPTVGTDASQSLSSQEPGQPSAYVVLMRNEGGRFFFDPPALHVRSNDSVTWLNLGDNHSTTAYAPPNRVGGHVTSQRIPEGATPWNSGILGIQGRGLTFTQTFNVPGTYDYFCFPHEFLGMAGRIVVDVPGGPAESDDFDGVSGFSRETLSALPSADIVGTLGTTYNWNALINVVLLKAFEQKTNAAVGQAQRLFDHAADLDPLLGKAAAPFKVLLNDYLSLAQAKAGFELLANKADELKALLAGARKQS